MEQIDVDALDTVAAVIRAVENVRRQRVDESREQWAQEVGPRLAEARRVLGGFGEGKALSRVVAVATEVLNWQDLRRVGVDPQSDPVWKVMQEDLLDPSCWAQGERRLRMLKMLKKLSNMLEELPGADAVPEDCSTLIDFAEDRGVMADTLRHRLRRHEQMKAVGTGPNHRRLYRLDDLLTLLTDEERSR